MSDLLPVLEVLEDTGVWGSASASKEMKMKRNAIIMRELTPWNMGPSLFVFSTNGGMGRECGAFYKRLSEMMVEKLLQNEANNGNKSVTFIA